MKKILIKEGSKETDVNEHATIFVTMDNGKQFSVQLRENALLIREVSGDSVYISPGAANAIKVS